MENYMSNPNEPIVRIAIVDDDRMLLNVFSSMMRHTQYHTHFFSGPKKALEEISAVKGHYHLLISDLWMPEMNGIELARKVRIAEPTLPIILMTGDATDEMREAAKNLGRVVFLEKPFPLESTLKEFIPKFLKGEI